MNYVPDNVGTEFYLAFGENIVRTSGYSVKDLELFVASADGSEVNVTIQAPLMLGTVDIQ